MGIDLLNLEPTKISRDLKGKFALIYGVPKSGKTSLAVRWPKSLLFAFEKGYNGLAGIHAIDIPNWTIARQVLRELKKPAVQEMYHNIIVDTGAIAWDRCVEFICQQNGVNDLSEIAWGKGQKACSKEFEKFFREISMLGYGIIFLAHAEEKIPFGGSESDVFIAPMLEKRPYRIINGMVDIIGCIDVDYENDERYLQLRSTPKMVAGSRFKYMPDRIPLDYDSFVNALGEAIEKQGDEGHGLYITDDRTDLKDVESRPFAEAMEEAKELWGKIFDHPNFDEAVEDKIENIIQDIFGAPVQLSKVPPAQQNLLELVVMDLKDLLMKL